MRLFRFAMLGLTLAGWTGASEAAVTIDKNDIEAKAHDGAGEDAGKTFTGVGVPTSTLLDATDGPNYSRNAIDFYTSGGQTVFSVDMEHKRNGTLHSIDETIGNGLYFTADVAATYSFSGHYNVTDDNVTGGSHLSAALQDVTNCCRSPYQPPNYLFNNYQTSVSVPNERLVLGEQNGNFGSILVGNLAGNLLAGHRYLLTFDSSTICFDLTNASPDGDFGASAVGNITLKIGEVLIVPEPTSVILLAILAMGASLRRRHHS